MRDRYGGRRSHKQQHDGSTVSKRRKKKYDWRKHLKHDGLTYAERQARKQDPEWQKQRQIRRELKVEQRRAADEAILSAAGPK